MVKILVCGFGSIGRKHANNLKELGADVKIWRTRANAEAEKDFEIVPSLDDGLAWCEGVVVATATDQHIPLAHKAASMGKHLYIEKPLSHNREGIDALVAAARNVVVEVGCQLRFHPNVRFLNEQIKKKVDGNVLSFQAWVGQRLDQWRPAMDYRKGYSAQAGRGGGALFDLVHEIDLIAWMCGGAKTVSADLRKVSDLEMDANDLANLILTTKAGASGIIQLDMISPAYRRGLNFVCDRAVYNWDFTQGKVMRNDGKGGECVHSVPDGFEAKTLIRDCMAYFLKRMDNPSLPASCSLEEAVHDLDILLAAEKSSASGQRQTL